MTTRSIYWRLAWKEYRLQRALWIAMAIITSVLLWLIYASVTGSSELMRSLYGIALAFPALYALGCGAMLFAGEHEAGTYEFERGLPVSASRVFIVKACLAALSTAALFGLTWALAGFLTDWRLPEHHELIVAWAAIGFFAAEVLAWSIFVSLLTTRVVLAAILGVAAASTVAYILVVLNNPQTVTLTMDMYLNALPWRIAAVAAVGLVDVWLGCRWFRERGVWRSSRAVRKSVAPAIGVAAQFGRCSASPSRTAIVGRLVWQHWRQSAWLMIALPSLILPLAVIGISESVHAIVLGSYPSYDPAMATVHVVGIFLAIFAAPLFGLCAFHPDQWNRSYRFLADRGVSPKYIWLSRQSAAWGLPIGLVTAFLLVVCLIGLLSLSSLLSQSNANIERLSLGPSTGFVVFVIAALTSFGYVLLGVSVGQFCSMVLRSGVLAGVSCVLLTALLVGWSQLMSLWGINWLWSVLPIPIAMLLATRVRVSAWLLERNTLRSWLPPALVLIVPVAAILTAVPLYRAYQLPVVDPGFSLTEYQRPMTAEEEATLALYDQAFEKLVRLNSNIVGPSEVPIKLTNDEVAWVEANRDAIKLTMKASQGKLFLRPADVRKVGRISMLADLLLSSGATLQKDGQLDAALQRYMAVMRIASQLRGPWRAYPTPDMIERRVYTQLLTWSKAAGQTPRASSRPYDNSKRLRPICPRAGKRSRPSTGRRAKRCRAT